MKRIKLVPILWALAIIFVMQPVFARTALAAGTTLSAGDIAFVGINSDGDDGFSFVVLKEITAGTSIYITDNGWNDDGSGFSAYDGDGIIKWTADSALSAGTVVYIKTSNNGVVTDGSGNTYLDATSGTVIWIDTNDNELVYSNETISRFITISYTGDQVFLYQGTHTNPVLITGIHYNVEAGSTGSNWDGSSTSNKTSALPDQLTNGVNAIWVYDQSGPTEYDNFRYDCSTTTGTPAQLRTAINNLNNWEVDTSGITAYDLSPSHYDFTVNVVALTGTALITGYGGLWRNAERFIKRHQ